MDFNAIVFYQDECSKEELTALDIKNSFYQSFGTSSKLKIGDLVIQIKLNTDFSVARNTGIYQYKIVKFLECPKTRESKLAILINQEKVSEKLKQQIYNTYGKDKSKRINDDILYDVDNFLKGLIK